MPSFNEFKTIHVVLFVLSFLTILTVPGKSVPLSYVCSNSNTSTPGSTYASNLRVLLVKLSNEAIDGKNFSQITVRDSVNPSNTIYGSYLCQGDITAAVCKNCVMSAQNEATQLCPMAESMMVWYRECMLRYSNRSFFTTLELLPTVFMWTVANLTEQENSALATHMNGMASQTVSGDEAFLSKEVNLSRSLTLSSFMQCMPDLSDLDCYTCLHGAVGSLSQCCDRRRGGTILTPSCILRYEVNPFTGFRNRPEVNEKNPVIIFPPPPPTPHTEPRPPTIEPPSYLAAPGKSRGISRLVLAAIIVAVAIFILALVCCLFLHCRSGARIKNYDVIQKENEGIESLQFDLITVKSATKNFSEEYKLGEGGFGEVYKGIVAGGQEIAVKRLSKSSGQGEEEFKNEVALVARLQHRNLVRLLGFCLGGGETLLIYEFVTNKSLDYFLFDPRKKGMLDWSIRCKIIGGIARGILYLHEDSRLRVIHRDLKASNVLLDGEMNPKISDFGMARMVGIDQTQGNTKRIVGTYGYMAPEYAMEGLYSIKSDVFSFGVLLLEIVSGTKNSGFHLTNFASSLLSYAWQLWNEGNGLELIDPSLNNICPPNEFIRCVHIGLLCVQEDAYNRPTMSSVVQMLTTETISLPKPERPAFSVGRFTNDTGNNQDVGAEGCSDNGLTISTFGPR
ncbi:Cysteine rich receptor like kinase [Trema orientale]|uniref:Cysteine rich receptor like kinase n=1 Tax=Trema orientale TaxID=63057 RepID=A0A2P5EFJ3_TREOI|nr:Cysteine rich receptor like kinase [Trema orientale]